MILRVPHPGGEVVPHNNAAIPYPSVTRATVEFVI